MGESSDTIYDRVTGEGLRADYWQLISRYPVGVGLGVTSGIGAFVQHGLAIEEENAFDHPASKGIAEAGVLGYCVLNLYLLVSVLLVFRALHSHSRSFRNATVLLSIAPLYWICANVWYDHNATAIYC